MAKAIMVLGPTRWRDDRGHPFLRHAPLDTRRGLARLMRGEGSRAFVMEDHTRAEGEDNFAFFGRLVREEAVSTFILFWPLGARLHGLEVEIGYLLTQLEAGRLDAGDIYLLAEKRLLEIRDPEDVRRRDEPIEEATLAWAEPGNRTRYHEDLVARGCTIRRWSSEQALRAHTGAIVLEHQMRS